MEAPGDTRYNELVQQPRSRLTVEEYLAFEERSPIKHEYHDGLLVAMSGAKRIHNRITRRVLVALDQHLAGRPCEPFSSDMKVYIEAANRFFYPDVVVDCTEEPTDDGVYTTQTPLIVEVLSESTAAYDRGDKFAFYRELPELREYVLVDTASVAIDVFRRSDDGVWQILRRLGKGDVLRLESVGLELPVDVIYADSEAL